MPLKSRTDEATTWPPSFANGDRAQRSSTRPSKKARVAATTSPFHGVHGMSARGLWGARPGRTVASIRNPEGDREPEAQENRHASDRWRGALVPSIRLYLADYAPSDGDATNDGREHHREHEGEATDEGRQQDWGHGQKLERSPHAHERKSVRAAGGRLERRKFRTRSAPSASSIPET